MAHWYIKQDNEILGPFGPAAMRHQVEIGNVHADTMLRKGNNGHFLAAQSFKGLLAEPPHANKRVVQQQHIDDSKINKRSKKKIGKR